MICPANVQPCRYRENLASSGLPVIAAPANLRPRACSMNASMDDDRNGRAIESDFKAAAPLALSVKTPPAAGGGSQIAVSDCNSVELLVRFILHMEEAEDLFAEFQFGVVAPMRPTRPARSACRDAPVFSSTRRS